MLYFILQVGRFHLVLVEGYGKTKGDPSASSSDPSSLTDTTEGTLQLTGRTDTNKRVIFPDLPVPIAASTSSSIDHSDHHTDLTREYLLNLAQSALTPAVTPSHITEEGADEGQSVSATVPGLVSAVKGDYVIVLIVPGGKGHTLRGIPLIKTTLQQAHLLPLPTLKFTG